MIETVYEAIGAHVGRYLRVKNGFATTKANYGYRAILANLLLESALTVEQVFGGARRLTWEALAEAQVTAGDGQAVHHTKAILNALLMKHDEQWQNDANAAMPAAAVNIAAEVQLIYKPYLDEGRKLSHLPYKVFRCQSVPELARDAGGKRAAGQKAVDEAERACMAIVEEVRPAKVMPRKVTQGTPSIRWGAGRESAALSVVGL